MIDKWEQLRLLIESTLAHNVQYSQDKAYDRFSYQRVLIWMDELDKREKQHLEECMDERGMQGLA